MRSSWAAVVRRCRTAVSGGFGTRFRRVSELVVIVAFLGYSIPQLVAGNINNVTVLGTAYAVAIGALGVGFLLRALRLLTLGQGGMMAIGAYTVLILGTERRWDFVSASLAALGISLVVSAVLGVTSWRLRSHYYILVTAVIQVVSGALIVEFSGVTGGENGLPVINLKVFGSTFNSPQLAAEVLLVLLLGSIAVCEWLIRSRWGRQMMGTSVAPATAAMSGVSSLSSYVLGNCVAGVLAAASGCVFAVLIGFIGSDVFSFSLAVQTLMVGTLCVGTRTPFIAAAVGAVVLEEISQGFTSVGSQSGMLYGVIVIVVGLVVGVNSMRRPKEGRAELSETPQAEVRTMRGA